MKAISLYRLFRPETPSWPASILVFNSKWLWSASVERNLTDVLGAFEVRPESYQRYPKKSIIGILGVGIC